MCCIALRKYRTDKAGRLALCGVAFTRDHYTKTKTVSLPELSDGETVFLFSYGNTYSEFAAVSAGFLPTEKHTQKITANSSTANAIQPRSTPVPFPANMS